MESIDRKLKKSSKSACMSRQPVGIQQMLGNIFKKYYFFPKKMFKRQTRLSDYSAISARQRDEAQ